MPHSLHLILGFLSHNCHEAQLILAKSQGSCLGTRVLQRPQSSSVPLPFECWFLCLSHIGPSGKTILPHQQIRKHSGEVTTRLQVFMVFSSPEWVSSSLPGQPVMSRKTDASYHVPVVKMELFLGSRGVCVGGEGTRGKG